MQFEFLKKCRISILDKFWEKFIKFHEIRSYLELLKSNKTKYAQDTILSSYAD